MTKTAYLLSIADLETGKIKYQTASESAQRITRRFAKRVYATVAEAEGENYDDAITNLAFDPSVKLLVLRGGPIEGLDWTTTELLRTGLKKSRRASIRTT